MLLPEPVVVLVREVPKTPWWEYVIRYGFPAIAALAGWRAARNHALASKREEDKERPIIKIEFNKVEHLGEGNIQLDLTMSNHNDFLLDNIKFAFVLISGTKQIEHCFSDILNLKYSGSESARITLSAHLGTFHKELKLACYLYSRDIHGRYRTLQELYFDLGGDPRSYTGAMPPGITDYKITKEILNAAKKWFSKDGDDVRYNPFHFLWRRQRILTGLFIGLFTVGAYASVDNRYHHPGLFLGLSFTSLIIVFVIQFAKYNEEMYWYTGSSDFWILLFAPVRNFFQKILSNEPPQG